MCRIEYVGHDDTTCVQGGEYGLANDGIVFGPVVNEDLNRHLVPCSPQHAEGDEADGHVLFVGGHDNSCRACCKRKLGPKVLRGSAHRVVRSQQCSFVVLGEVV